MWALKSSNTPRKLKQEFLKSTISDIFIKYACKTFNFEANFIWF